MPDYGSRGLSPQARASAILALCGLFSIAPANSATVGATEAVIQQHVRNIQDGLLPPVLVKGETPSTTILTDRMAALHVPGVSVAVIHDGKLEWARGFGVRAVDGLPVTTDTLFQAASISKPVTAIAALRLVQSETLELDRDVNQYLKSWKIPPNKFTESTKVTLRELLTHSAGMTVHGFAGYARDAALPTIVQILDGRPPANNPAILVDTAPGTIWRYSGGGYVVIQQLLEDVTGTPFAKLLQYSVLDPIGMTRSAYAQPLPSSRLPEAATPYGRNGAPVSGGPHTYPEMAPAGLWTTPSDLAQYAIEIQQTLQGKSTRVLSTTMARQMLTADLNHQGLGPHIGGDAKRPYFEHSGANEGYRCDLVAYNAGDGAIIMTNGDNGGVLIQELMRTIAHEYAWPDFQPEMRTLSKVDNAQFDLLKGTYELDPGLDLVIMRDGDHFLSQATGQGSAEIFPENDHDFFLKMVNARITFVTDQRGHATQLVLHQNGRDTPAKRLDDAVAKPIEEALLANAKRFREQVPAPESEPTLRQLIGEVAAGTPNYARMSSSLADLLRRQIEPLQSLLSKLGPVQAISFKAVGPGGDDDYTVTFANGKADCRLGLAPDGTIVLASLNVLE